MVSREEVRLAFINLLGREPETEAYAHHCGFADVWSLRQAIAQSPEGLDNLRSLLRLGSRGHEMRFERRVFIFIHLEKCGGTTAHGRLATVFDPVVVSDMHMVQLANCTLAELSRYDFLSGHISYADAQSVPARTKIIGSVLRDPVDRLISFYRFHYSHAAPLDDNLFIRLAHELEPADFFRRPEVRSSPRLDNHYLRTFADMRDVEGPLGQRGDEAVAHGASRLAALDVVGVSEQMDSFVEAAAAKLGVPVPPAAPNRHVTDRLAAYDGGFQPAPFVPRTRALMDAIEPLVRYDTPLYSYAKQLVAAQQSAGRPRARLYGWRR